MVGLLCGMVLSWKTGKGSNIELVNIILDDAIVTLDVLDSTEHPLVHSDRGGHYRWPGRLDRTDSASLPCSMFRKGYSPDNAACESFFVALKLDFFTPRIELIQHSSI